MKLNKILDNFFEEYIPEDFDPFVYLTWTASASEKERLWKPIKDQIENGPSCHEEMDAVKSSLLSESATSNQRISFHRFDNLEKRLVAFEVCLLEALVNSDEIDGALKVAATETILRGLLVYLQVSFVLAPKLMQRKYFNWFGLLFVNKAFEDLTRKNQ